MQHSPTYIKGFGYYVPERVLDNFELSTLVDTSNEWIIERTGIEQRRIVAPGETCSDMICRAAAQALESSGLQAADITHVLVGTISGDDSFPATAAHVQNKMGIRGMAFDFAAACASFIYGMQIARGLLAFEPEAKILLAVGEVLSIRTDWTDRSTCVLFGDAAGAAVLSNDPEEPRTRHPLKGNAVLEGVLCDADGKWVDLMFCHGGGSSFPYKLGAVVGPENFTRMNGREIFKHAVRDMLGISRKLMDSLGCGLEDLDLVVPHQANLRIVRAVTERLGVPREKVVETVQKYGNTSASSVILALGNAMEEGRVKPGSRVLMTAFGSGLTWGSAILRFC
ncbi:MAG: ketoacyl-ACP synthase III [Deltaproteobacteria bacterium]|jgi:3-oxoacyl-[acyl-carrier-protein] synthase-3|nr:ketoacyl-ACP synthase III [Deltaproteobacteria bacterium]